MERRKLSERIDALIERGFFFAMPAGGSWADGAIEARYDESFEVIWMEHWKKVSEIQMSSATKNDIDRYRESSFTSAFRSANSSEIAALVSDDIDLLLRCEHAGREDEWTDGLATSYLEGRFPAG